MITQKDKDQIDQILEDTFPKGSIPPNGTVDGAGTTLEVPASTPSTEAATAPAASVLIQPSVEYLKQFGALRHQVKELQATVRARLLAIQADKTPRTLREKELLSDEVTALWREATALDELLFNFVVTNRWQS